MPFSPLPKTFSAKLDELAVRGSLGLELGCGSGGLGRLAARPGLQLYGLDRMPPEAGVRADLRADALRLPVRAGSVDLILAGNLVPHLLAQDQRAGFVRHWLAALKPAGSIIILEDEPRGDFPARANYRDLQAFLVRLDPRYRGPLVAAAEFLDIVGPFLQGADLAWGTETNAQVADTSAVLAMLKGPDAGSKGPQVELRRSIIKHGLDYGKYWWMMLSRAA